MPGLNRRRLGLIILFAALGNGLGCTYRFTNAHSRAPGDIETIAVEAIYDTGREVIPHEIIWDFVQRELAMEGSLRLSSQSAADAILRVQVINVGMAPSGAERLKGPEEDPEFFDGKAPPLPGLFRLLPRTGPHRERVAFGMELRVDVIDLRTRQRIMSRSYGLGSEFRALYGNSRNTLENMFVRYEEGLEASLALAAQKVARRVVQDLMVQ